MLFFSSSFRADYVVVYADCRQKAILPPEGGRIALSANERIAGFLDFAIQAKFAYVNKLSRLRSSLRNGGGMQTK
jgi:hypothetical protein